MKFIENNWYHIYNRGNNKRPIFFEERNYLFFLEKTRKYIKPTCDIISYCLMPNHFHFLIAADERTVQPIRKPILTSGALNESIRLLLSSYTKAINIQQGFTGNLFQQKTKSKCVLDYSNSDEGDQYDELCFHYIHQNARKAGLVKRMEDWPYSSFADYAGLRKGMLCNIERGLKHFDFTPDVFYSTSYKVNDSQDYGVIFQKGI